MQKKDYEIIEHTADIGIGVKAGDLAGLFSKAACAMFDIIAQRRIKEKSLHKPSFVKEREKGDFKIKLRAQNIEELFVNWLSELLYLSSVNEIVFRDFKINKIDESGIDAEAFGEGIVNYKVKTEIKAVTYHELEVKKAGSGWEGKVIFDV